MSNSESNQANSATGETDSSSVAGESLPDSEIATDENTVNKSEAASQRATQLYEELMDGNPKGFARSSMGKFNAFREWLAEEVGLDWKTQTYAVGSSGIAHNFGARWTQNNSFAGRRVPLGVAFIRVPDGADRADLIDDVANTSRKFVNGKKPTSFETIILFVADNDQDIAAELIMASDENAVGTELRAMFPAAKFELVDWEGSSPHPSSSATSATGSQTQIPIGSDLISKLFGDLTAAGLLVSKELTRRVVASLCAKQFLILAGLSGSGKTQLGIGIARWFASASENVAVIPVGSDWTSTHHLLGHADALDSNRYVRTPALDLILAASDAPEKPHFLVLDEMNLSHVEHYFSTMLSTLETGEALELHDGPDHRSDVPPNLPYPRNLFIIGTVNVDETTQTFSPKVIDRGNVIEFTVSPEAVETYLNGAGPPQTENLEAAGAEYGDALVETACSAFALQDLPEEAQPFLAAGIKRLFSIFETGGHPFGFRTIKEVIRFSVAQERLSESWTAQSALDAQIVQRLIPRLNGDTERLVPILAGVLAFALASANESPSEEQIQEQWQSLLKDWGGSSTDAATQATSVYPLVASKVLRMARALGRDGFTTAIEA